VQEASKVTAVVVVILSVGEESKQASVGLAQEEIKLKMQDESDKK
jgi:hypothetical protein